MTFLYIALGFAGSLLALAALAWCLGYLIRSVGHLAQSVATLLPPTGQFIAGVADLKEQQATSVQQPGAAYVASVPQSWPTRRDRGVPPPPVDTVSETGFAMPPVVAGDRDWFDRESIEMLAQAQRPVVTKAEGPPGPTVESDR
jgi:hypothetical protein